MSSSSSSDDDGFCIGYANAGTSSSRIGDFEGPSSLRHRRTINEVWPEPFVEALAAQVAIDASHSFGRLAAAPAIANVFQVCSTWRAVSQSDMLWNRLNRIIWDRSHLMHATWYEEYIFRHLSARNFRTGRSTHYTLHFDQSDVEIPDGLTCRCLTLSDLYIACGFADGTVRLFDLGTRLHVRTLRPQQHDRLGRFSRAVSGIVILDSRLIFASMDGNIHVAIVNGGDMHTRRAHMGRIVDDGVMVDFSGCRQWWVGLYAGVPGRSFHIWDGVTEELVFIGGTLTDPEAVPGWHMLTEHTASIGRVRVTSLDSAVACTSLRKIVFDLSNQGLIIHEEESRRGLIVDSLDVSRDAYVVADSRRIAFVHRLDTLVESCRFGVRQRNILGCMNQMYALMCAGGVIRVWEVERGPHGDYLYRFPEMLGEVKALVSDDRHVVAATSDTAIHLWDFGAEAPQAQIG